jgi:hypothetical protein
MVESHMKPTTLALSLGALLVLGLGACGSDGGGVEAQEYAQPCDPAAPGSPYASGETFRAFLDAEKAKGGFVVNDMLGPTVGVDPTGRLLPAYIPPTFSLFVPKLGDNGPDPARAPASTGGGFWRRLAGALTLERKAHAAACPPLNGENYLLRVTNIKTPSRHAYQAVLTVNTFIPDRELWVDKMSSRIGLVVDVTVARAVFTNGVITAGPFVSSRVVEMMISP